MHDLLELSGAIELARSKTIPALHPERKGMLNRSALKNWVEKHGGLPTYINSFATAILRENPSWSISRVIATAVNQVRKICVTGKAFNGKGTVSTAVKAAACKAIAKWNAMKAKASTEMVDDKIIELSDSESYDYLHAKTRKKYRADNAEIPDVILLSDKAYFEQVLGEEYEVEEVLYG